MSIADRLRGILQTRNLTLYKVCRLSRESYPKQPSYHLHRNLYFQLRSPTWSPTIEQLLTLSRLSGYRLADWLALFGFDLDDITRSQVDLRQPRTALLDQTIFNTHAIVLWFADRATLELAPPVAPLTQVL